MKTIFNVVHDNLDADRTYDPLHREWRICTGTYMRIRSYVVLVSLCVWQIFILITPWKKRVRSSESFSSVKV